MRILLAAATLIAMLAGAGLMVAQWGCSVASDAPTDVLVANQRLRSENARLVQENARLSADNENLQQRLNEQLIEGAGQEGLARDNERLRGELGRARVDAAEELARRDQLEEELDEERRTRDRLEQTLRDIASDRGNDRGVLGWLTFLVVVVLLLLANVAFWRERWWRSRFPKAARGVRIVREGTAMTRSVRDLPSVKVDAPDR